MIKKRCTRFSEFKIQDKLTEQNALIYLELRENQCPKRIAKVQLHYIQNFCSKPVCKFDSTQLKDGPSKFRILKVKPNLFASHLGWQFSDPEYKLPDNRINCLHQFQENTFKSSQLETQLSKNINERRPLWEKQERLRTMYDFELDREWKVDLKDKNQVHRSIIKQLRKLRDKSIVLENLKFQAISNLLVKDRIEGVQNLNNSSLRQFQSQTVFDPILSNPELMQVKIQQFNKKEKNDFELTPPQNNRLRSIELSPLHFLTEGEMNQEELYNIITELSDEEDQTKSQTADKKKQIKEVLIYGFEQKKKISIPEFDINLVGKKKIDMLYQKNNALKNSFAPECTALIHKYIEEVNSKDKYCSDSVSNANIIELVNQRSSIQEYKINLILANSNTSTQSRAN